jgi:acetoin:2,6-dichlorophenolindophenol oxidoreductase subunit alpha
LANWMEELTTVADQHGAGGVSDTVSVSSGAGAVADRRSDRDADRSGLPRVPASDWFHAANLGARLPLPVRLYWQMALVRQTERLLLDLFQQNRIFGTTHTCLGQEANAVGVINALDRGSDTVWSNHRCHGHFLAYCGQVTKLLAEIMGRRGGVCSGRGGSQHLSWGRFHSSGVQGGLVPLALGTALADRADQAISVVFLGDGTMGEGLVYEGLNLAALWSLPVLFVVEDNGIAQTTPRHLSVSGSIAARAVPFGVRCFSLDDTDVEAIHEIARTAIAYVRGEGRPAWLHIETIRLGPHSKGDDTRHATEIAALWESDPLALQGARIAEREALDNRAAEVVTDALAEAEAMPIACASSNR